MPSIAIVGAGPQLGLAIARTFGSRGFDVALVARNRAKLDDLVERLTSEAITAAPQLGDQPAQGTGRTGVQATHVGIGVSIGTTGFPGVPTAQPEEIAPVYWELHTTHRDEAERVFVRWPSGWNGVERPCSRRDVRTADGGGSGARGEPGDPRRGFGGVSVGCARSGGR